MVSEQQITRLEQLRDVFLEENTKLNLSAMRTQEACWVGNVLDSLPFLDLSDLYTSAKTILDIGTGGGFPLLPLAICLPDIQVIGLDATQKKIDAIHRMIHELQIPNANAIAGRFEEIGTQNEHREQYDIVTARAVAPLNVLLEYAAPLTKTSGHIVCWKSMNIDTEMQESLNARSELSCHLVKTHEYELPGDWGKRQLLIFEKTNATQSAYPRRNGEAKKEPIL